MTLLTHAVAPLVAATLLAPVSGQQAGEVVCRSFVPTADRRHGEVRLVRGDDLIAVQTLLYTPSLRRGLQKIRQQEMSHWPPERDGHEDSQAYLEVLDLGKAEALSAFESRVDVDDSRQKLLIEVVQQGDSAWVGVALPELSGEDAEIEIREVRSIATRPVSSAYARAAMEIILQSVFHRPESPLEDFLSGEASRIERLSAEDLLQPVGR